MGRGASRGTRVGAGWGIDLIWGEGGCAIWLADSMVEHWKLVTRKKLANFDDVTHLFGDQNWQLARLLANGRIIAAKTLLEDLEGTGWG